MSTPGGRKGFPKIVPLTDPVFDLVPVIVHVSAGPVALHYWPESKTVLRAQQLCKRGGRQYWREVSLNSWFLIEAARKQRLKLAST